jgi:hypothetical protein
MSQSSKHAPKTPKPPRPPNLHKNQNMARNNTKK